MTDQRAPEKTDALARSLATDLIDQNHMLEAVDGEEIGVYDSYDNKFYDTRRLARVALEASK